MLPAIASTTPTIALLRPVDETEPTMIPAAATATAMPIMLRAPRDHAEVDLGEAVAHCHAEPFRTGAAGRGGDPAGDDDDHQREDGIEDRAVGAPPLDDSAGRRG